MSRVAALTHDAAPAPEGLADPRPPSAAIAKRAFDLTSAAVLLVATAPLLAGLAWWIRRHDGGPALFAQERVGQGGRPFRLYKLRTMTVDAEARLPELSARNAVRGPALRIPDDPRVTGPGRVLRPLGLDELPQLVNVLRGEMSLVGPRPALPEEVAAYAPGWRERLTVPPGITGLWQLDGRQLPDVAAWVALDRRYVRTWSLTGDLILLARTAAWLVRGPR